MREVGKQIIGVVAMLIVGISSAYAVGESRVGVGIEVGEYSLLSKDAEGSTRNSLGGAGGVGFDYQFVYRHFVFTTGIGAFIGSTAFHPTDPIFSLPNSVDKDGDIFTYQYRFAKRYDQYTPIALELPVLIGFEVMHFQLTAGCKFRWYGYCASKVSSEVETWGEYPQFIDPFTGMPEHRFYGTNPQTSKGSYTLKPEVAVSVEAAWLIQARYTNTNRPRCTYRIAIFADYGVTNSLTSGSGSSVTIPTQFVDHPSMLTDIRYRDYLSTDKMNGGQLHSLFAGIRFSILFSFQKQERCLCVMD